MDVSCQAGQVGLQDLGSQLGSLGARVILLQLEQQAQVGVRLGEPEPRQIVAGIGEAYDLEDLVGKKVMVVTNLKQVKLMGVESHGMLLAAGEGDKDVVVAEFNGDVKPGESVH